MSDSLRLGLMHVNSKDQMVLNSLLELIGSRGGQSWSLAAGHEADAVVVDVDSAEGGQIWPELDHGDTPRIALTRRRDFSANLVLTKPIRSQPLVRVLEDALDAMENPIDTEDWPVIEFEPRDGLPLAECLRRRIWGGPVLLGGGDLAELCIDPGAGAWYFGASDRELVMLIRRSYMAQDGHLLSSSELPEHTHGLEPRKLSDLKWRTGVALSSRALHPELAGPVEFMLPQIPFQALSDTAFSRQARILTRQRLGVDALVEASQADLGDVVAFLNACHVCGYLVLTRPEALR